VTLVAMKNLARTKWLSLVGKSGEKWGGKRGRGGSGTDRVKISECKRESGGEKRTPGQIEWDWVRLRHVTMSWLMGGVQEA